MSTFLDLLEARVDQSDDESDHHKDIRSSHSGGSDRNEDDSDEDSVDLMGRPGGDQVGSGMVLNASEEKIGIGPSRIPQGKVIAREFVSHTDDHHLRNKKHDHFLASQNDKSSHVANRPTQDLDEADDCTTNPQDKRASQSSNSSSDVANHSPQNISGCAKALRDRNASEGSDNSSYVANHPTQDLDEAGECTTSPQDKKASQSSDSSSYVANHPTQDLDEAGECTTSPQDKKASQSSDSSSYVANHSPQNISGCAKALRDRNASEGSDDSSYVANHPTQDLDEAGECTTSPQDKKASQSSDSSSYVANHSPQNISGCAKALRDRNASEGNDDSSYVANHPTQDLDEAGECTTSPHDKKASQSSDSSAYKRETGIKPNQPHENEFTVQNTQIDTDDEADSTRSSCKHSSEIEDLKTSTRQDTQIDTDDEADSTTSSCKRSSEREDPKASTQQDTQIDTDDEADYSTSSCKRSSGREGPKASTQQDTQIDTDDEADYSTSSCKRSSEIEDFTTSTYLDTQIDTDDEADSTTSSCKRNFEREDPKVSTHLDTQIDTDDEADSITPSTKFDVVPTTIHLQRGESHTILKDIIQSNMEKSEIDRISHVSQNIIHAQVSTINASGEPKLKFEREQILNIPSAAKPTDCVVSRPLSIGPARQNQQRSIVKSEAETGSLSHSFDQTKICKVCDQRQSENDDKEICTEVHNSFLLNISIRQEIERDNADSSVSLQRRTFSETTPNSTGGTRKSIISPPETGKIMRNNDVSRVIRLGIVSDKSSSGIEGASKREVCQTCCMELCRALLIELNDLQTTRGHSKVSHSILEEKACNSTGQCKRTLFHSSNSSGSSKRAKLPTSQLEDITHAK